MMEGKENKHVWQREEEKLESKKSRDLVSRYLSTYEAHMSPCTPLCLCNLNTSLCICRDWLAPFLRKSGALCTFRIRHNLGLVM